MNQTIAPARHVHLDIELTPETQFHYRSRGQDARRVVLHRGDAITFTCGDRFSVQFPGPSPFQEAALPAHQETMLQSHEWFVTSHVRESVPFGVYPYAVEVRRDARAFQDHPEIVIESSDSL